MVKAFLEIIRWSGILVVCTASSKSSGPNGLAALPNFKIEMYVIVDKALTNHLSNDHAAVENYVKKIITEVNKILAYLEPPGSISLTGIKTYYWGEEVYFATTTEGAVLGDETLKKLLLYARPRTIIWTADLLMLLTRRELVLRQETVTSINGIAIVAGACSIHKLMVVSDVKGLYTTYLTTAHEIGHLLGSHHDGDKTSKACQDNNYIMATDMAYAKPFYSYCTKAAINEFLRTPKAKCLFQEDYVPAITTDPKREEERAANCNKYLSVGEKLLGTETYGWCSFSCYSDQSSSFVLDEKDGTPCYEKDPSKKCRNGTCAKEVLPPTETNQKEKDQKEEVCGRRQEKCRIVERVQRSKVERQDYSVGTLKGGRDWKFE
ncbi:venom metalloproteinase antarease-like TpachMP_A [Dermacentor silvarum]|uniref:venom metalloproteinase antarease-like TpachMP_A n=1 Tax=Dermacentor silvarum TaxID=543639 RepID=UPI002100DE56|nr:venom metalloproteinase antarease-like TpachMP_A [Dermacentor silvarum]